MARQLVIQEIGEAITMQGAPQTLLSTFFYGTNGRNMAPPVASASECDKPLTFGLSQSWQNGRGEAILEFLKEVVMVNPGPDISSTKQVSHLVGS